MWKINRFFNVDVDQCVDQNVGCYVYVLCFVINGLSYNFSVAFFFLLNNWYWSVWSVTIQQAGSQVYQLKNKEFQIKKMLSYNYFIFTINK